MATEGEFPKVDGDILYGSEINSFGNYGGRLKFIGSITGGQIASATAETNVGSFVVTSGIVTKMLFVTSQCRCATDDGLNTAVQNIKLGASGGEVTIATVTQKIYNNTSSAGALIGGSYVALTGNTNVLSTVSQSRNSAQAISDIGVAYIWGF